MKILISGYVGKRITGIGRNLQCLLENSTGDDEFVIYTNEDMQADFSFTDPRIRVKTYRVSKNSSLGNLLWTTFVFPFLAFREKADKVLIPNFSLLLIKFRPTVVIMHDLIEFNVPEKFSKNKMFYRTKLADPITAKMADKIITVSENSKKDIERLLHVDESKITVIHNGVDTKKFCKMDKESAQTIISTRNWPIDFMLYVGTVDHPGKNVMGVIKAFERLSDESKYNGALILAGMPGSNYEAILDYSNSSKYKGRIILTGFVTDEELIALYSICKVFVFISLYEGFGIPPLEALSCGAKVVVSDSSSLPEVVGKVGWMVDPTDELSVTNTILEAMEYEDSSDHRKQVEDHLLQFDWREMSKKFVQTLTN